MEHPTNAHDLSIKIAKQNRLTDRSASKKVQQELEKRGLQDNWQNLPQDQANDIYTKLTAVPTVEELVDIREEIDQTEETLAQLRNQRDNLIRQAKEQGHPVNSIAQSVNLTRAQIYAIIKNTPHENVEGVG